MSPAERSNALWRRRGRKAPPLVVNLYGQSADMQFPIGAICERYDVPIVQDAVVAWCQVPWQALGYIRPARIYSFNGNKIITTSGGGMLGHEEKVSADRARFVATQARDPAPHYQHSTIGYNYRMSNILAGVGRGQLKVLDQRVEARRAVYARGVCRRGVARVDAGTGLELPSHTGYRFFYRPGFSQNYSLRP